VQAWAPGEGHGVTALLQMSVPPLGCVVLAPPDTDGALALAEVDEPVPAEG
jgi:hypothetical protein